jgi:polysaccharide pyruvyl transferase WcaK-like protein
MDVVQAGKLAQQRVWALVANSGNGNLGDEATLSVVIEALRSRCPDVRLAIFTDHPSDARERHGIEAIPYRSCGRNTTSKPPPSAVPSGSHGRQPDLSHVKSHTKATLLRIPLRVVKKVLRTGVDLAREITTWPACFRQARTLHAVIFSGGGQLQDDFGGAANYPLQLCKWALLARLVGAKVVFLSVGASRISSPLSRILLRAALRLSHYCSFRDAASRDLVAEHLGITGKTAITPDLVFGSSRTVAQGHSRYTPGVVAINAFPHYDNAYWPAEDLARYASYIGRLAEFATRLLGDGYRLILFPTQIRADRTPLDHLEHTILERLGPLLSERIQRADVFTVEDVFALLRSVDFVVATRFHALVFSLLAGKPTIAISNQPKMSNLMVDLEQQRWLVDADEFEVDKLHQTFHILVQDRETVARDIKNRVDRCRAAVNEQYEVLVDVLRGSAVSAEPGHLSNS